MSETELTHKPRGDTMQGESGVSKRMRDPVQKVYDRQVARCLSDIDEVFDLPSVVEDRIKRAIEYTCKDVDKLNKKESGHGYREENFNR